jgi:mono/diheme cytochrome c family protein
VPVDQLAPLVGQIAVDPANVPEYEIGRAIYVTRCAKCHGVKPVNAYAAQDWASRIMPKMARKAKLTPEERETVLAYVLAARETRPALGVR